MNKKRIENVCDLMNKHQDKKEVAKILNLTRQGLGYLIQRFTIVKKGKDEYRPNYAKLEDETRK